MSACVGKCCDLTLPVSFSVLELPSVVVAFVGVIRVVDNQPLTIGFSIT